MLTPEDIEFMKQTRKEIVANRQSYITIVYTDGGASDPITGEPIGGPEVEIEADAVVTEISSRNNVERRLSSGVEGEQGDIWLSVDAVVLSTIYERDIRVNYDGNMYEILSKDKKGIGERNRVEMVGRLIT